jgi:transposase-like protein
MKSTELKQLMGMLGKLDAIECQRAKEAINNREAQVESSVVAEEITAAMTKCPLCGHTRIAKAGSKGGRKRFKCKSPACGKTFNALTGTPLARLQKAGKHIENAKCMAKGMTIRATADEIGVNATTVFRWRHRFLQALQASQPNELAGVVEADETFFLESFKGQRKGLPRPAKKRGTPAKLRGLSIEQIPVLVARDRSSGATLTSKIQSRKAEDIGPVLMPRLAKDAVLVTDGAKAYRKLGKEQKVEVRQVPAHKKHKTVGSLHINGVNAYDKRLKEWMGRFHGVATKNLDAYLGWRRLLDRSKNTPSGKRFLLASIGR